MSVIIANVCLWLNALNADFELDKSNDAENPHIGWCLAIEFDQKVDRIDYPIIPEAVKLLLSIILIVGPMLDSNSQMGSPTGSRGNKLGDTGVTGSYGN